MGNDSTVGEVSALLGTGGSFSNGLKAGTGGLGGAGGTAGDAGAGEISG